MKWGDLWVDIKGRTAPLQASLQRGERMVAGFRTKVSSILNRPMGGIGILMSGAIAMGVRSLWKSGMEATQATDKLRAALRATGSEVDQNMVKFAQFAGSLQKLTGRSDEATTEMVAGFLRMGVASDKVIPLIKLSTGLSKAMAGRSGGEISVEQAARMTMQAVAGQTTALNSYLPTIIAAKTETERMAIIAEQAAIGWREMQARSNDAGVQADYFRQSLGDVVQEMGMILVGTVTGGGGLRELGDMFQKARRPIFEFGIDLQEINEIIGTAVGNIVTRFQWMSEHAGKIMSNLSKQVRGVWGGLKAVVTGEGGVKGEGVADTFLRGYVGGMGEKGEGWEEELPDVVQEDMNALRSRLKREREQKLADFDAAAKTGGLGMTAQEAADALKGGFGGGAAGGADAAAAAREQFGRTGGLEDIVKMAQAQVADRAEQRKAEESKKSQAIQDNTKKSAEALEKTVPLLEKIAGVVNGWEE